MKTALIQSTVWWTVDMPLGIAQLAGALRHAGHEPCALDLNILLWHKATEPEKPLWDWENFQYWNNPELVKRHIDSNRAFIESELQKLLRAGIGAAGFSVNSGNQLFSLELARLLKKEKPDLFIMFGGQHFFRSENASAWMQNPEADCVFTGPGDLVMPAMLTALEKTGGPAVQPGTLLRSPSGIINGGPAQPVPDLDALPFADFTVLPVGLYANKLHIPFQSSRGCIWKCRYCSATNFWQGYNQMSGERMFSELMHHKSLFPDRTHVEFYDLTANGRPEALHKLSELLIEDHKANGWKNFFGWKINAVIRPEMTPELLKKLRQSFCKDIIYGIESGSERVLRLMNKNYRPDVALQVLHDTHQAEIHTTANFMFGFPGETEEDFGQTLAFLEKAAPHLDRVYASATFTSLEEGSYLTDHRAEFGIAVPPPDNFHNLYWESSDATNTYPVRMERYKRFRARAIALGLDAYKGVQGDLEQNSLFSLAEYYRYKGDHAKAVENLLAAFDINSANEAVLDALLPYYKDLALYHSAARQFMRLQRYPARGTRTQMESRISALISGMRDKASFDAATMSLRWMSSSFDPQQLSYLLALAHETVSRFIPEHKLDGIHLFPLLPQRGSGRNNTLSALRDHNTRFNAQECSQNRSVLGTYPRRVFLQMDGPCNADCIFCSRDDEYEHFSLDKYLNALHGRLRPLLRHAEEVLFTGSGEFLLLPEAERIIEFFNRFYPQLEKQLATNASHKNRRLWELISAPESRYTIQVSLHSATPQTHKTMTRLPSFDDVMGNLEYLASRRSMAGHPKLHLMFVMTTENIQDLPAFVRLGAKLKADKLIANHAYIYRPDQRKYSLHGNTDSDKWLAQAYAEAEKLGVKTFFPPLFTGQVARTAQAPQKINCHEPWTQLMVNPRADALPCDLYGEFSQNLLRTDFWALWNGPEYRKIRASIREKGGCLARCPRHNPDSLKTAENLQIQRRESQQP
ncbi:MAG: radical SAM protein [Elusimicrobia bacterium]|nr:radical SAM protein [Elusimicrobiota bacterium]